MKRFVNADTYSSTGQDFIGYNMFAYCNNNPTMYMDSAGYRPLENSIDFLLEWLVGDGSTQYYAKGSSMVKALKESQKMQFYIESAIENYIAGQSTTTGSGEFTPREDGYDLYLSTQHFDYTITVIEESRTAGILWWKHEETRYTATVVVHDTYNFDSLRESNSLGNMLNNFAYNYHLSGGGNDYEWFATYTYSTKWKNAT